jgi:hypothetical protein
MKMSLSNFTIWRALRDRPAARNYGLSRDFCHRARTAFRAASDRCSGVSLAALALPPFQAAPSTERDRGRVFRLILRWLGYVLDLADTDIDDQLAELIRIAWALLS